MKRILSIVAAIALLVTFMVPAFADDTVTITVGNPKTGANYYAYKIFDVTTDGATRNPAYAYTYHSSGYEDALATHKTIDGAVKALAGADYIDVVATANADEYLVTAKDGFTNDALGAFLKARFEAGDFPPTTAATQATNNAFTVGNGYYFITTTQGTVVSADTVVGNITINDKNVEPTITKEADDIDLAIGDTVTYTSNVTLQKGITKAIFYDIFPAGVTFNTDSVQVKEGGSNLTATTDYVLKTSGTRINDSTFEIDFTEDYLNDIEAATVVTITYTGTLNESAVVGIDSENKNDNTAKLQWGNEPKTIDANDNVTTSSLTITKVDKADNSKKLAGVKFKVYDGDATTPMSFISLGAAATDVGQYRLAKSTETGITELETDSNGQIFIKLLENDGHTYKFEEIKTNDGYQLPTSKFAHAMNNTQGDAETDTFTNSKGVELPETGGIGTIIFVTLGSIAVLAAGIFLISNKRISKEEL